MPDLEPLFSPESVVIIGASADTHTLRGRTTDYLIAHGYPGRIYPVTRSLPEVFGLRSYPNVAELPEIPDLAVVIVPAAYVVPTLEECGRKGVRAAVVISSGFAEERGAAAQERDRALREVIGRLSRIAFPLRDRFSADTWRILNKLQLDTRARPGRPSRPAVGDGAGGRRPRRVPRRAAISARADHRPLRHR